MAKQTITPHPRSPQAFSKRLTKKTNHHSKNKKKSKTVRHLKVRKSYYPYQFDQNPDQPYRTAQPVPWVEIKGFWLNEMGFTIDTELAVEIANGCLLIRAKARGS